LAWRSAPRPSFFTPISTSNAPAEILIRVPSSSTAFAFSILKRFSGAGNMMKKQLMAVRERKAATQTPTTGPLSFDSNKLVAGILFHVIDDGIALNFDTDSLAHTTERLRRQHIRPTISRSQWADMTNEQRLTWLLVESRTCVILSGGVATLGPLRAETMIAT
jgi:hypothetical protein